MKKKTVQLLCAVAAIGMLITSVPVYATEPGIAAESIENANNNEADENDAVEDNDESGEETEPDAEVVQEAESVLAEEQEEEPEEEPEEEEPEEEEPEEEPEPEAAKNGLIEEDGKLYYYIDDEKQTGYQEVTTDDITNAYYFTADGSAFTDGVLEYTNAGESCCSYFQADGTALKGSYKAVWTVSKADEAGNISISSTGTGQRYYFKSNGMAFNKGLLQFKNIGNTYYMYFGSNGRAIYGTYKYVNGYSVADDNGNVTVASKSGLRYYLQANGQAFTKGLLQFTNAGRTYAMYFQTNGQALANTIKAVTVRYKADTSGNVSVWTKNETYTYKIASNCQASIYNIGWKKVSGTWNYYDGTGKLLFTSNGMYTAWSKIKNTSSGSGYIIVLDRSKCELYLFNGKAGSWTPFRLWKCSPGKPSTPTPAGTYKVYFRKKMFGDGTYDVYWATSFKKAYYFHSVLYWPDNSSKKGVIKDGRLGQQLSHGCIRLSITNAKWIYDNIPNNTKVVIY